MDFASGLIFPFLGVVVVGVSFLCLFFSENRMKCRHNSASMVGK